ncbi:MAG: hypothetical protein V2A72_06845 [Candidatus Omnitrophota bacterium]
MIRRVNLFLLIFVFVFMHAVLTYAQERKEQVPAGMKIEKVGDLKVLVPQDSKLKKQGDVMMQETTDEYVARKFEDTEKRFETIEKGQKTLEAEIKSLKKQIEEIKKTKAE